MGEALSSLEVSATTKEPRRIVEVHSDVAQLDVTVNEVIPETSRVGGKHA